MNRRHTRRILLWTGLALAALIVAFVAVGLWTARPTSAPALVYFTQWDAGSRIAKLQPVLRTVQGRSREDFVRQAVEALLAGPNAEERREGHVTEIPAGTRLLGVRVIGQTAHVDLSGAFEKGGGSATMLARLYQVVYTATHFSGVEEVRILIDGNIRESMGGEGVMINVPVRRPPVTPRF